jgi:hypothetical protein
MLEEFDAAVALLESSQQDLDALLFGHPHVSHGLRMQAGNLVFDIVSFCAIFGEAHIGATQHAHEEAGRVASGWLLTASQDERARWHAKARYWDGRLQAAYKAVFIFIRAHQDVLYLMLVRLQGRVPGQGTSMQQAFQKAGNPVRRLLDARLPEYAAWFPQWRDMRNDVKEGASFSIVGPQDNLVVNCNPEKAIRVADVATALRMSAALAALVRGLAEGQSV